MPLNVWILIGAQALAMCTAPFIVFIGSIHGRLLAPTPEMATLPVGLVVVGTVVAIKPVTWLMSLWGRKRVMLLGAAMGILGGLVGATASWSGSFPFLCFAALIGGAGIAVVHQYRFAAMESVPESLAGTAAARVLLGGLIAAWLGPEIALIGGGREAEFPFMGGWLSLAAVQVLALLLLCFGYQSKGERVSATERGKGRPLTAILRQPVILVAISAAAMSYAIMSFVMTATPLGMTEISGHSLEEAKWVIQIHIMAMYLPSLVSGWLISKLGLVKMMVMGLLAYLGCVLIATSGTGFLSYLAALILLGIGWNFLFVGGTSLLPQGYQESERFRVQGINDLFVFGAQATAALSAGAVLAMVGWNLLLVTVIPFVALHGILMVVWIARGKRKSGVT